MLTFDEQLEKDFEEIFLNESEFAEMIRYRSQEDPLTAYGLCAIFNRAYLGIEMGENVVANIVR